MTEWLSFWGFSGIINNMNKLFWEDEMTDSNKVKKVEKDSIKIPLDSSTNVSEKIKLGQILHLFLFWLIPLVTFKQL